MSVSEKLLSKKVLMLIIIISLVIFVIGIMLIALGFNEAFYINNSTVLTIFELISFMGEPIFFIVLVAVFFYIYDKKFAKNMAFSLLTSVYINELLKESFQDPRPAANVSKDAEYGYIQPGYGFPSGHTQSAVATWGYMGYNFKEKPKPYIAPIICSIIIGLIAASRVILGVHDVQDVIGGYLFGIVFLLVFIYLEPHISEKINPLSLAIKISIVFIVSISIFLIGTLIFPSAGLGLVKNPPVYADEGAFAQVGGAILGLSVGYLLEDEYVNYEPSELDTKYKLINLIIGIVILMAAYMAFALLIEGTVILRFIRYAIVSFIAVAVIPFVFTKINKK